MVELVGVEGVDHAHLVRDAMEVGDRIGHPGAVLADLSPFTGRSHEFRDTRGEGKFAPFEEFIWTILLAVFDELGLVIEQV